MNEKFKKLVEDDFDGFIKLLKLYYGTEGGGFISVLQDYYKKDKLYFIINGQLVDIDSIYNDISTSVKEYKLLKKFNLV
jgi:hypothetical protein